MRINSLCIVVLAGTVFIACHGGNGLKTSPDGSSDLGTGPAAVVDGGVAGQRGVSSTPSTGGTIGGTGGSQMGTSDANGVGSSTKADGSLANPDQANAKEDVAVSTTVCPTFVPCGGDIVGTWHLKSSCISSSGSCEAHTLAADYSRYHMSLTFAADGTATMSVSGTLEQTFRYSAGCFTSGASLAQSCADMGDGLRRAWQEAGDAGPLPANLEKFQCTVDSTGACLCNEVFTYEHQSRGEGTYTLHGNRVIMRDFRMAPTTDAGSADAGADDPSDYCVSGDTLKLGMGSGGFSVFTR